MPSAAPSFVFFVATKKMKLLSGNPDGFAFVFGAKSYTEKNNSMNYLAASYEVSTACNLCKITQQAAGN